MLSRLSGKFSVLQTSSADNLVRQQFQGFNICTEKMSLKNKRGFQNLQENFWFAGRLHFPGEFGF